MFVYALFLVGKNRDFNNVLRKKLESYMSATGSMVTLNLKTLLKDIKFPTQKIPKRVLRIESAFKILN